MLTGAFMESALPPEPHPHHRDPNLLEALAPVVILVGLLAWMVARLGQVPHIPLILGIVAAAILGMRLGWHWKEMRDGMVAGITIAMPAILILLVIGILIGLWIQAGVVPLLIEVGLRILTPSIFLPAACGICCIVSLATGSSWTTAGTVGIALLGVGTGLGIPVAMTAGAIISGAYFGDKMSPLSDTTNLAPAVAGSELFEHVRHMMFTTTPSILLALAGFTFLGLGHDAAGADTSAVQTLRATLQATFNLSPWLLLAPGIVLAMVLLRVPALPALFGGAAIGALLAGIFQGSSVVDLLTASMQGYTGATGVAAVDELLTRGGMESMYGTIALILCALSYGGILERIGVLRVLANAILALARGTGGLVTATVVTCFGMNALAADQYLAIIMPGRMFKEAFHRLRLHPKNLSRVLEDAGTITSPLIAWNTCGATMQQVLGVDAGHYWMYCFFNLINPFVSIALAYLGWTMVKLPPEPAPAEMDSRPAPLQG